MSNPFLMLQRLNKVSHKLLNQLEQYPSDTSPKEKLRKLFRRSFIISLLSDKYIIAVTGLQGVGKTTLMQTLYNLENDVFLDNAGQGERVPILITESNNISRKFYVHKLVTTEFEHKIEKIEINNDLFKKKSHEYEVDDLMLEIEVPVKVFNGTDKHFLLLPGFHREDDYLKELTYSSLRAASTSIIVFNQQDYARSENESLINEIKENFSDAKPIFNISFTNHNEDKEFTERVISDLGLNEDEKDRVTVSGKPAPDGWDEKLINSIRKYSCPNRNFLHVQLENIKRLKDDYERFEVELERFLRDKDISAENKEFTKVNRVTKVFNNRVNKLRKNLREILSNRYQRYFNKITKEIKDKLGEEKLLDRFSKLFRNSVKVQNEFEELVQESLRNSNETTIEQEFVLALNELQNRSFDEYNLTQVNLATTYTKNDNIKLIAMGERNNNTKKISEETFSDIKLLSNRNANNDIDFSDNYEESVKLLPTIAIEGLRIGLIVPNIYNSTLEPLFETGEESETIMKMYSENKKEVAVGLGVLFGMDVIPDGELDLFGLLQANHGTQAATTMASTTIAFVLGGIVLGGASVYLNSQLNKIQLERANLAEVAINYMKDYYINNYIQKYDNYFETMEEILENLLRQRYNINQEFANIQNIYNSIASLKEIRVEIGKAINDNTGKMGYIIQKQK